jgi:hypothetical protein
MINNLKAKPIRKSSRKDHGRITISGDEGFEVVVRRDMSGTRQTPATIMI